MRFLAKAALVAAGVAVGWSLLRRRAEPAIGGAGPVAPPGPAPVPPPGPAPEPPEPAEPTKPAKPAAAAASDGEPVGGEPVEGYCVKERKKVQIKDPVRTTTKNGRPGVRGTCPDCGSKIFRFLPQG